MCYAHRPHNIYYFAVCVSWKIFHFLVFIRWYGCFGRYQRENVRNHKRPQIGWIIAMPGSAIFVRNALNLSHDIFALRIVYVHLTPNIQFEKGRIECISCASHAATTTDHTQLNDLWWKNFASRDNQINSLCHFRFGFSFRCMLFKPESGALPYTEHTEKYSSNISCIRGTSLFTIHLFDFFVIISICLTLALIL